MMLLNVAAGVIMTSHCACSWLQVVNKSSNVRVKYSGELQKSMFNAGCYVAHLTKRGGGDGDEHSDQMKKESWTGQELESESC